MALPFSTFLSLKFFSEVLSCGCWWCWSQLPSLPTLHPIALDYILPLKHYLQPKKITLQRKRFKLGETVKLKLCEVVQGLNHKLNGVFANCRWFAPIAPITGVRWLERWPSRGHWWNTGFPIQFNMSLYQLLNKKKTRISWMLTLLRLWSFWSFQSLCNCQNCH